LLNCEAKVSNEAWYKRQGYEQFLYLKDCCMWTNVKTGARKPISQMFLKKKLAPPRS
jgi:hypothetical protein